MEQIFREVSLSKPNLFPMSTTSNPRSRYLAIKSHSILILVLHLGMVSLAASLSPKTFNNGYSYDYNALVSTGLNEGFKLKARVHLELLYRDDAHDAIAESNEPGGAYLVSLQLDQPEIYENSSKMIKSLEDNQVFNKDYKIYAILETKAQVKVIKQIYSHRLDSTFYKNLKKSILMNLMTPGDRDSIHFSDDNLQSQPELFSPNSRSSVYLRRVKLANSLFKKEIPLKKTPISAEQNIDQLLAPELVEGFQNVTFNSRLFSKAGSNITTNFRLKLVDVFEGKGGEIYDGVESMKSAIEILHHQTNHGYLLDSIEFQREAKQCTNNHCKMDLRQLIVQHEFGLGDESMAKIQGSVAFLRLLDGVRQSNSSDIKSVLANLVTEARATFLDILAAARTRKSISIGLDYLDLPNHSADDLETAERFLIVLSIAAKTASMMNRNRSIKSPYYFHRQSTPDNQARSQKSDEATFEFIIEELMKMLKKFPPGEWNSYKLRWSTILTVGTLINALQQEKQQANIHNVDRDFTGEKESTSWPDYWASFIANELDACSDADCRIVMIQAIGNAGQLNDSVHKVLKKEILGRGRRESVSAIKVLRDILAQRDKFEPLSDEFNKRIKILVWRIAYDDSKETTARVIACEIMVRFLPNPFPMAVHLIAQLPSFENRELATMVYSRMLSVLKLNSNEDNAMSEIIHKYDNNWYWKCCLINGSSASFVQRMADTDSVNASYGLNVELLDGQKILKESSIDVFLDTNQKTQDLISLSIFAQGLTNIPLMGQSPKNDETIQGPRNSIEDEDENLMAGMQLKFLGGSLRPYIFFSSYFELAKHLFWGTAKDSLTAFKGNLLLIDHDEGYPLISGFVAEQRMRGVLSVDVGAKADASIMSGSNSIVRTGASVIVQASQSIFTGYKNLWLSDLFSFGGETLIDFLADATWTSQPYQLCLRIIQPEYLIRFNLRKRNQLLNDKLERKLKRQNYRIGAKSYSLTKDNNQICTSMFRNKLGIL